MALAQQPGEQPAEHDQPGDDADSERNKDAGVQAADAVEDVRVLAQDQQDERAGEARQEHGGDRQRAAQRDEPRRVRRRDGDEADDTETDRGAGEHRGPLRRAHTVERSEQDDDRGDNQPEEQSVDELRVRRDQPRERHHAREEHERGENAEAERDDEREVHVRARVPEPACEQEAHESRVERADRFDEPAVDPEDERHGSAAHSGNHVRGSHAETPDESERRVLQRELRMSPAETHSHLRRGGVISATAVLRRPIAKHSDSRRPGLRMRGDTRR